MSVPDLVTSDELSTELCTLNGAEHDWRPYEYQRFGKPHTSWRCVWCHVVRCGDYDEVDGCVEPYHHPIDHRSESGVIWPLCGNRPKESK